MSTTSRRRATWQAPKQWPELNHTMYPTMRLLGIIISGVVILGGLVGIVWVAAAAGWLA